MFRPDMGIKPLRLEEKCKFVPYNSFEATVHAAQDRQAIAKIDEKSITGQALVGYHYNGSQLALIYANQKVLLLYLFEDKVCWNVLDQASLEFVKKALPDYLGLIFPEGRKEKWEWKKILDDRIGKLMRKLAPSDTHLWVYMEELEDNMMFDGYHVPEENCDLLYFDTDLD